MLDEGLGCLGNVAPEVCFFQRIWGFGIFVFPGWQPRLRGVADQLRWWTSGVEWGAWVYGVCRNGRLQFCAGFVIPGLATRATWGVAHRSGFWLSVVARSFFDEAVSLGKTFP